MIETDLKTKFLGQNTEYFKTVDSTNNIAKKNLQKPHGTVFVADIQTSGRGRTGKSWFSDNEDGLWMSILLKPKRDLRNIEALTPVVGLAVLRALKNISSLQFSIKWPNDIVLNSKKICGILCEGVFIQESRSIICGIGINLNQTSFDKSIAEIATSLKKETGLTYNKKKLMHELLNELELLYIDFSENGLKNILQEYKQNCITLGKEIKICQNGKESTAFAYDLTENCELLVDMDGQKKVVFSGDVSVRGIYDYV